MLRDTLRPFSRRNCEMIAKNQPVTAKQTAIGCVFSVSRECKFGYAKTVAADQSKYPSSFSLSPVSVPE